MTQAMKKLTISYSKQLKINLVDMLEDIAVPTIKELIVREYDLQLNGRSSPQSKLAPELYQDRFVKRLELVEYVELTGQSEVTLNVPDIDTFDFSPPLGIIETYLEGMIGRYYEVGGDVYRKATGQATYRGEFIDKNMDYLFSRAEIKRLNLKAYNNNRDFELNAFSNSPPIDIFYSADEYVEENLEKWQEKAIDKTTKEFDWRNPAGGLPPSFRNPSGGVL